MNETLELSLNEGFVLGSGEILSGPEGGTLTIICYGDDPGPGPDPEPQPPTISSFTVEQLDGFPLTAAAEWTTDAALSTIDWGDGSPPETFDDEFEATHIYQRTGIFAVTLTVRNDAGPASETRGIVIALNSNPGKTFTRGTAFSASILNDDRNGGLI